MTRWQAVAACFAAVLLLPAAGRAQTPQPQIDFDQIKAVFSDPDRATTYSLAGLTGDNENAVCCTYRWTLTLTDVDTTKGVDIDCNNHGVLSGTDPTFVWHHGNKGDPIHDDGCDHGLQGKYGHQGLITVVVSDNKGSQCTATYKGTLDSSVAASNPATEDAASNPVCTVVEPPPPPPPCRCARLTARILPSSIEIEDHYHAKTDQAYFFFRVHWVMTCTTGSGGCSGEITPKIGDPEIEHLGFGYKPTNRCETTCAHTQDGTFRVGVALSDFTPFDRKGRRLPILLERSCQARALTPIRLSIAFDAEGKPSLSRSKLQ